MGVTGGQKATLGGAAALVFALVIVGYALDIGYAPRPRPDWRRDPGALALPPRTAWELAQDPAAQALVDQAWTLPRDRAVPVLAAALDGPQAPVAALELARLDAVDQAPALRAAAARLDGSPEGIVVAYAADLLEDRAWPVEDPGL